MQGPLLPWGLLLPLELTCARQPRGGLELDQPTPHSSERLVSCPGATRGIAEEHDPLLALVGTEASAEADTRYMTTGKIGDSQFLTAWAEGFLAKNKVIDTEPIEGDMRLVDYHTLTYDKSDNELLQKTRNK